MAAKRKDENINSVFASLDKSPNPRLKCYKIFMGDGLSFIVSRSDIDAEAFLAGIVEHVVLHCGKSLLYFALREDRIKVKKRLLYLHSELTERNVSYGKLSEKQIDDFERAMEEIRDSGLRIVEPRKINMTELAEKVSELSRKSKFAAVCIDDFFNVIDDSGQSRDDAERSDKNVRELLRISEEVKLPIIVLAKLDRFRMYSSKRNLRKKPDVRELGECHLDPAYQHASRVGILHVISDDKHSPNASMNIIKNRSDMPVEIDLEYDLCKRRFRDVIVPEKGVWNDQYDDLPF